MALSERCSIARVKRVLGGLGTDMTGARHMCYIAPDSASQVAGRFSRIGTLEFSIVTIVVTLRP